MENYTSAKTILYELLGQPGSGKSYLCDHILSDYKLVQTIKRSTNYYYPGKWRLMFRYPYWTFLIAMVQISSGSFSKKDFYSARSLLKDYDFQQQTLRSSATGKETIIDEGVIHSLFSFLYGKKINFSTRAALYLIIKVLNKHNIRYLFYDVEKDQCVSNFKNRSGNSRFNNQLNAIGINDFYRDTTYDTILSFIKKSGEDLIFSFSHPEDLLFFLLKKNSNQ
jgi:hypothetical protein